jgi:hypothetical protein
MRGSRASPSARPAAGQQKRSQTPIPTSLEGHVPRHTERAAAWQNLPSGRCVALAGFSTSQLRSAQIRPICLGWRAASFVRDDDV